MTAHKTVTEADLVEMKAICEIASADPWSEIDRAHVAVSAGSDRTITRGDVFRLVAEVEHLRSVIRDAVQVLETCEIMQGSIMHDELIEAITQKESE